MSPILWKVSLVIVLSYVEASVYGGGVGGHWSDVRTVSDIAKPIPFLHTVDADMIAYRQGKTRKGSYAFYMDVHHPDIVGVFEHPYSYG